MTINQFIAQARELAALRQQFPGIPIRLTGLGFYAPEFTVEQWEQHYAAPAPAGKTGGETPSARRSCDDWPNSRGGAKPPGADSKP